jgi:hypothetical protein
VARWGSATYRNRWKANRKVIQPWYTLNLAFDVGILESLSYCLYVALRTQIETAANVPNLIMGQSQPAVATRPNSQAVTELEGCCQVRSASFPTGRLALKY